jgi:hypothetical protein
MTGMSERQAEVITNIINESQSHSELVTKSDLKELRHEIQFEMKCLEQRMTHKVGGMIVGAAGVMMFLEKFL